ncbi:Pleiotropic regulatory protein [hydrothermal vent metagenome]|uniref:Pleiotropic regulatory protein n=1 Tax=hydrothermal vent metagenome TaxID=652676 RepID=A0A3B0WZW3_9ZZZZ
MFYQLPPVGNPVSLGQNLAAYTNDSLPEFLSPNHTQFYASGTAALAAAVMAAMAYVATQKTIPVDAEVILPAYGCPDLVSAVIFAGAKPVLVDMQANRPWLDLDKLAAAITVNTVAIVGVSLFGVAERWQQLRTIARRANVLLIEDSAQYFPSADEPEYGQGDVLVFSFGRGKPVSLLGGGATCANSAALYELLPKAVEMPTNLKHTITFFLKAKLYNAMISPWLYWLPQFLPFLHLGETRYHALREITGIDAARKKRLASNIMRYQNDKKLVQNKARISKGLNLFEEIINLPAVCAEEERDLNDRRLLRYPILVNAERRDEIYEKLKQAGLGVSKMYPSILPEIDGLQAIFSDKNFPQASEFAAKLLTLPVHAGVSKKDVKKIMSLLARI